MRKILFSPNKDPIQYTSEEALAFLLENNFSKQQYMNIRLSSKSRNCDIYPPYSEILKTKMECRINELEASDCKVKVPLKNLLEHTLQRIVMLQEEVIESLMNQNNMNFLEAELICSYGFDGSSGHSNYKQQFCNSEILQQTDSTLFATTMIPLRLKCVDKNIILWNNPTPQSVRFCRPIKLEFIKETKEVVKKENDDLNKEIKEISEVQISLPNNKILRVKFNLFLTILDGTVLNYITDTKSFFTCPVCGAKPSDFLSIRDFKSKLFQPKPDRIKYGISPLHFWIRLFECILHISYRIDIKHWSIRGNDKEKLKVRKAEIQQRFWEKLSLHVDKSIPGGSGNTNDGNTSRRAFSEPATFAEITDVDETLITRFRNILISLSCQYPLDLDKFETYCFQTANIFMDKYPWYPMTPTVHKILIHSRQILEYSVLPVGFLGEDAAESRNKLYKHDRLFHARKSSRKNNLTDVFNRAMETSDPLISSVDLKKRMQRRVRLSLPVDVLNLLQVPDFEPEPSTSTSPPEIDNEDIIEECIFNFDIGLLNSLELETQEM